MKNVNILITIFITLISFKNIYANDIENITKQIYLQASNDIASGHTNEAETLFNKVINYCRIIESESNYLNDELFFHCDIPSENSLYKIKLKEKDYVYAWALFNDLDGADPGGFGNFNHLKDLPYFEKYFNTKQEVKEIKGKVNLSQEDARKLFEGNDNEYLEIKSEGDEYHEIPIVTGTINLDKNETVDSINISCKESGGTVFKLIVNRGIFSAMVNDGQVSIRIMSKTPFFILSAIKHENSIKITKISLNFYKYK
jgi:hypothetical protein